MEYLLLFASAFGAATLLPFYSEIALVALLSQGYPDFSLWFVATLGNTLGAVVNWLMGRYLRHFEHKRWFPFKTAKLTTASHWFNKYGKWSLLLAWLPIGGDALTFIAGMMRVNFMAFFLLTAIGKGARYAVMIALYESVT